MRTQQPLPQRGTAPNFRPISVVTTGWMDQNPLGREVPLCYMETQLALPKKGAEPPNFRPMSVVAKRLNGSRCHLVRRKASRQATLCYRWGPSLLPRKGAQQPPIFAAYLLWPNGWMDQDGMWHGGRPRPRQHCARWGPISPSPEK